MSVGPMQTKSDRGGSRYLITSLTPLTLAIAKGFVFHEARNWKLLDRMVTTVHRIQGCCSQERNIFIEDQGSQSDIAPLNQIRPK